MKQVVQRAGRLALALLVAGSLGLSSCKKDDTTTVYGNWTKASTFAGTARRAAVTFTIGNLAYVGTGVDANGTRLRDFWSFNPSSGAWTQVAPLPAAASARLSSVAFAANGKGYVGTGLDDSNKYLSDFWEFTPSSSGGSWRQVASLPVNAGSTGRYGALAATLGNVGYVGFGYDGNTQKDLYTFTPPTSATDQGSWKTLAAAFPGEKRMSGAAFVVNNALYIATGTNNSQNVTDVWSFDGMNWTQRNNLVNKTTDPTYDYSGVVRANAVAFTIGSYGYVATGSTSQACYQYDPGADSWTKMNTYIGAARNNAVGFGIGNYGYVGLGYNGTQPFDDFYQLDPSVTQQ